MWRCLHLFKWIIAQMYPCHSSQHIYASLQIMAARVLGRKLMYNFSITIMSNQLRIANGFCSDDSLIDKINPNFLRIGIDGSFCYHHFPISICILNALLERWCCYFKQLLISPISVQWKWERKWHTDPKVCEIKKYWKVRKQHWQ